MVGWWNYKPPKTTDVNSISLLLFRSPNFIHFWLWFVLLSQLIQQHICCHHCQNICWEPQHECSPMASATFERTTDLSTLVSNSLLSSWVGIHGSVHHLVSSMVILQCLSKDESSWLDSQLWTKTRVWICRRRGSPVFSCSTAVFFSSPQAVLSWPSFFFCSHPHTPAAHPICTPTCTALKGQLIHPLWDTCIGFCCVSANQRLLFCPACGLKSLLVFRLVSLFHVVLQPTISSLTPARSVLNLFLVSVYALWVLLPAPEQVTETLDAEAALIHQPQWSHIHMQ